MISKRWQRGMSIWMIMYVLASLGAFGFVGLKLFPIYTESGKIDRALEGVITDPETPKKSKRDIQLALLKRLDIDYVLRINFNNMKEYVFVEKNKGKVKIDVIYRAETPLFANVLLVADFKKSVSN